MEKRWRDDLRFNVLFDNIPVTSGRWEGDIQSVCNGTPFSAGPLDNARMQNAASDQGLHYLHKFYSNFYKTVRNINKSPTPKVTDGLTKITKI